MNHYDKVIALPNILMAWEQFASGKSNRKEIIYYWKHLEDHILDLHQELYSQTYQHSEYTQFVVQDTKKRIIHKACVKDRIVHQLVFDYVDALFEKKFIYDSYASRKEKGTHRAVKRLQFFCDRTYGSHSKGCWILKCDIKKFFDSVDHDILYTLIKKAIKEKSLLDLIKKIIDSYDTKRGKGLPLGNLTSQIFANIYLHEFDYYAKHQLRIKKYIRFSDDFVVVSDDKEYLQRVRVAFQMFLKYKLKLVLPQEKTSLRKYHWGVDFLGYIVLPNAILPRTRTRRKVLKKIKKMRKEYEMGERSYAQLSQTISSYLGMLGICTSAKLRQEMTISSIIDQ